MAQREAGYRCKWKKWLAIYLAFAPVVYLIVLLVVLHHGGAAEPRLLPGGLDPG